MQMELGCKSLPYTPHVFFVSETGAKPAAGMDFDAENGVTVLVVVEADAEFAFDEPVQWAAILDTEYQAKRASGSKTFSALQHEFFNSSYSGTSSSQSTTSTDCEEWCFLRQGSFDQRGAPKPHASALLHIYRTACLICRARPDVPQFLS